MSKKKKNKIIFVTGGARSGKSSFAISLAQKLSKNSNVLYIATAETRDKEMKKRVEKHCLSRPKEWQTIVVLDRLKDSLPKKRKHVFLLDCMTMYISNQILKGKTEDVIFDEIKNFISILRKRKNTTIIVSNEVGMGIVPRNRLARIFRDISGRINQYLAQESDEAYFTVSGLHLKLK